MGVKRIVKRKMEELREEVDVKESLRRKLLRTSGIKRRATTTKQQHVILQV